MLHIFCTDKVRNNDIIVLLYGKPKRNKIKKRLIKCVLFNITGYIDYRLSIALRLHDVTPQ